MIDFPCAACGKQLKVNDALAGKMGKCPYCGERVSIPQAAEEERQAQAPRARAPERSRREATSEAAPEAILSALPVRPERQKRAARIDRDENGVAELDENEEFRQRRRRNRAGKSAETMGLWLVAGG